tara:strand:- start:633 stop:2093 length:1461 start_codon:yes stop_codon:yes gene_type:complete
MKRIFKPFSILFLSALAFVACDIESDLYVDNPESPNDNTLASDPVALEATAGGLFRNWYMADSNYYGPGMALNTMADVSSCSWGNAGMRDLSGEPRGAFNNTTSYGNNVTRGYFNSLYSVLTDANQIALAVSNGVEFSNNDLMASMAKFSQALAMGSAAMYFDKVWLSDETGIIGSKDGSSPQDAMAFAIKKLDEAIAIASAGSFTVPANYMTKSYSAQELASLMNSYGARMLAGNARTKAEKDSADWSKIAAYAAAGMGTDFSVVHDDVTWYDYFKTYLVYPGWARIDLRVINLMDPNYPDYWPTGTTILPEATSVDARLASDFEYLNSQNFRPERGEYHYSSYRYDRYDDYITEWTIPTVEIPYWETHMYLAEAKMRAGDVAGAAAIINAADGPRKVRGEITTDVPADAAAVAAAIHYERMVEFPLVSSGISFFEMRGKDMLQAGTLLHFPIPGQALEAIPADYYTYGGSEGVAGTDYSTGGWR